MGFLVLAPSNLAGEKSLAELEREANQVLSEPDNILQRKLIGPVFEFADRCAAAGKTNEATKYYMQALERQPWNLDAQMAVARLLEGAGNTGEARKKAELVWKYAETDALLAGAAKMIGEQFSTNLEQEPMPMNGCRLVLVPYAGPDMWLLNSLRVELRKILGIPVVFRKGSFQIPKPKRDPLHIQAQEMREHIAEARKNSEFDQMYRKIGLMTNSLASDEQVFAATESLMAANKSTHEQVGRFRDELALLRRLGPQWDGDQILEQLGETLNPRPGGSIAYLGVTKLDIYANESRFLFGLASVGGNAGIISYHRYTASLLDEPPNQERLKQRLLKQALSTIGLMYGLPRCTDPTCSRAYANNLAEHDAKQIRLCMECQLGFAKRLGTDTK